MVVTHCVVESKCANKKKILSEIFTNGTRRNVCLKKEQREIKQAYYNSTASCQHICACACCYDSSR